MKNMSRVYCIEVHDPKNGRWNLVRTETDKRDAIKMAEAIRMPCRIVRATRELVKEFNNEYVF